MKNCRFPHSLLVCWWIYSPNLKVRMHQTHNWNWGTLELSDKVHSPRRLGVFHVVGAVRLLFWQNMLNLRQVCWWMRSLSVNECMRRDRSDKKMTKSHTQARFICHKLCNNMTIWSEENWRPTDLRHPGIKISDICFCSHMICQNAKPGSKSKHLLWILPVDVAKYVDKYKPPFVGHV